VLPMHVNAKEYMEFNVAQKQHALTF